MKIIGAQVIVTGPGRNYVTLKITTEEGLSGQDHYLYLALQQAAKTGD